VVGASAGGVPALQTVLGGLPEDLPASVLVVVHGPGPAGALRGILARGCALPVTDAEDGRPLTPGVVALARQDWHLQVAGPHMALDRGPSENGHRPAVDVLFRSAAHAAGVRVVGAVLSGTGDDGTAGLLAVRAHGGAALVQAPSDALFPDMPANARALVPDAEVLPAGAIAARLAELARAPAPTAIPRAESEVAVSNGQGADRDDVFSCPECGGPVKMTDEGGLLRFRCRVGHTWSEMSFMTGQAAEVEQALWAALRALEERGVIAERLAARADERGHANTAGRFRERALESAERARVVRDLIESLTPAPSMAEEAEG
jgi:two-component system chemotaxis response regulator CheB